MRVLVCDDNRDAADSLALLLQSRGHEVRTAYEGHRCLDTALEWRPEVALLDVGMPQMDGYRLARELRAHLKSDIMLVAITGYATPADRQRALEAGFDLHMAKPADFLQVAALVASRAGARSGSDRAT